jgi:uncharacterized protein (TIRG00374 family)
VKRVLWLVKLVIAAAVLLWLYRQGAVSVTVLSGLLVNWPISLAALALFVISGVFSAWRFCILLRPRGHRLALFDSVRLTFIGLFFNTCLPGGAGGDATRIYYASVGNAGWRTELATIVLLDRLAGMFALFLWPVIAAFFFRDLLAAAPVIRSLILIASLVSLAMAAGMLLVMSNRFRQDARIAWLLGRLPMRRKLEDVFDTLHGYRRHVPALLGAVLVSLVIHTLSVSVTLLAESALDPVHFSWRVALVAPLGFLANLLPLTPGGLGVGEAAFASLFAMAGLSGGTLVMLAWRGVTLFGSAAGVIFYLQGKRRMVHVSSAVMYESGA